MLIVETFFFLSETSTCGAWPTTLTYGCTDEGEVRTLLGDEVTSEFDCEMLCVAQNSNGCCLWSSPQCYFKEGSSVSNGDDDSGFATNCRFRNIYSFIWKIHQIFNPLGKHSVE